MLNLVDAQQDRRLPDRFGATLELFGAVAPDPHRLVGLAATAAAEIPASVTRLRAAPALEALRAAGDLSAAIGGIARRVADVSALPGGTIAALAIELAEQVSLLALNATIETTLIGGDDSPLRPEEQRTRAEHAIRELTLGVAAVRDCLGLLEAAVAALGDPACATDRGQAA